jgi:putative peptidoglycan lipid II flippase
MGILHTFRHFLSPAFSPLALNVMFLLALLFICPLFGKDASSRIIGLTFGVLLGGLFQVLVQVPAVVARGFRYRVIIKFSHPAIKKLWSLMLPAFWGLSIAQINIFVDNALAWRLGAEAVASLNYSMRIIWFPLGVFGVAIGSAILPTCSHQITKGDTQALRNTLTYGINLALSLSLPASVVLIVLREPIIKLIFEQGIFNAASTQATTFALLFYSVGLVGFIGGKVLIPIFYSLKVPQIPVKTGVVCLSLNIILNIILMKPLRQGGLALATSISLVLNTILLGCFLYRKFKIIDGKDISKTFFKILLLSSILGGVLFGFHYFYQTFMREPGKLYLMLEILLSLGITIGTIFSLSYLLKVKELKAIPRIFRSG